jgi:hypothetical protein
VVKSAFDFCTPVVCRAMTKEGFPDAAHPQHRLHLNCDLYLRGDGLDCEVFSDGTQTSRKAFVQAAAVAAA